MATNSDPADAPAPHRRIAVVVLNYNTAELAIDASESARPHLDPEKDSLVIVDNKSTDESAEKLSQYVEARSSLVSLLLSPRNGGFAAGNNVALRAIDAEAYLLLNSDTVVQPGAPELLYQRLKSDARIGLVSPRLFWPNGEPQVSCFRFPTPMSELIAGARTGPITRLLQHFDVPLGLPDQAADVPWTSFAAAMIRREAVERVGFLDETFFMYYEDVDYCRMLRRAGFRVVHEPRAHVVHLRGKSSPVKEATRLLKRRPTYYYRSRQRYYEKSFGLFGPVLANSMWTLGRGIALMREQFGSKAPHTVDHELVDNWSAGWRSDAPTS